MHAMNKIANMRNWSERMSPAFSMSSRPNLGMSMQGLHPQHKLNHPQNVGVGVGVGVGASPITPPQIGDSVIYHAFNVPFASDLAGPDTEDILHATADAVLRWTHPAEVPDDVPVHELPVHADNLGRLRKLCKDITNNQLPIEAHVISTTPKHVKGQVTTVCLSGSPDLVWQTRDKILNETPLSLVCSQSPPRFCPPRYLAPLTIVP